LCKHWRTVDLGLAPPVDSGDMALPTCLWMGKPYLALSSPLPWSRRPVALLETAGATEWIAKTRDDYIERAGRPTPAPNPDFRARLKPLTDPIRFARGFAGTLAELVRHRKMK
jgi:predicted O-linked N-acetylglucosamine transferase (SPINDLY family)